MWETLVSRTQIWQSNQVVFLKSPYKKSGNYAPKSISRPKYIKPPLIFDYKTQIEF